jgi:hypothetical protein
MTLDSLRKKLLDLLPTYAKAWLAKFEKKARVDEYNKRSREIW